MMDSSMPDYFKVLSYVTQYINASHNNKKIEPLERCNGNKF